MTKKTKNDGGWDKLLKHEEELPETTEEDVETKSLISDGVKPPTKYSWGSKKLDALAGELEGGIITEVYGESMSGKTTLGVYCPIATIAKSGPLADNDRFIIVDCDGGVDQERFKQILECNKLNAGDVVAHMEYYKPTSFSAQHDIITELGKRIKDEGWNPRLVVVDAISSHYRGIFLRTNMSNKLSVCGIYTGKLDLEITDLRRIAVDYGCPVILTNWPMTEVGMHKEGQVRAELDMIGGRAFSFLAKVVLKLEAVHDDAKVLRKVVLKKHRARKPGVSTMIEINDAGIKDVN